ncbi:hypothetical protein LCGC14_1999030 [marine sediment metagenome]|uniref:Uncharacterized protein n=1 Tax=marine sediment metagenome TaxID=412755 RepID=A0A0F9FRK4_9ZZZZ
MGKYKRIQDKKYIIPVTTILFNDENSKEHWNGIIAKKREETVTWWKNKVKAKKCISVLDLKEMHKRYHLFNEKEKKENNK